MLVNNGCVMHHDHDSYAHVASNAKRDEKSETAHECDLITFAHFEKGKYRVEGRQARGNVGVRALFRSGAR